eukprot:7669200-Pyramimonas_sp.AAC.1
MPSPLSNIAENMMALYLIEVGNGIRAGHQLPMPPIMSPVNVASFMAGMRSGTIALPMPGVGLPSMPVN